MKRFSFAVLLFSIFCLGLSAQSKGEVLIFPVLNETESSYIDALSGTVIDDVFFMMSQMEPYSVKMKVRLNFCLRLSLI